MSTHLFCGFDIETAPVPELVENFTKPFPEFDADAVKCGNLKDPAKIVEKKALAFAEHAEAQKDYWEKARANASLCPFTGRIVVIGLITEDASISYLEGDEKTILRLFWYHFTEPKNALRKWVYWSGCGDAGKNFDLDYIVTRSRILGITVPPLVRNGRFYSSKFVDLASEFLLYQREQYLSLTKAGEMFGLYELPEVSDIEADRTIWRKREDDPVQGSNFWEWYEGRTGDGVMPEEQRLFALRYLRNDLLHLWHIAPRILT
jgi:hypothetical protein